MEYTKSKDHFLNQTACDYDLDIGIVENIYRKADDVEDFYKLLEEEIKTSGAIRI